MGWRLKLQASRLFRQPFVQVQIKENIKPRVTDLCEGKSPVTGELAAQRASNAEYVFIWWRHHDYQFDEGEQISLKFDQNTTDFVHGNAFENAICKMVAIFTRPQCVNIKSGHRSHRKSHRDEMSAWSIMFYLYVTNIDNTFSPT